jgi:hypothetical protein
MKPKRAYEILTTLRFEVFALGGFAIGAIVWEIIQ